MVTRVPTIHSSRGNNETQKRPLTRHDLRESRTPATSPITTLDSNSQPLQITFYKHTDTRDRAPPQMDTYVPFVNLTSVCSVVAILVFSAL